MANATKGDVVWANVCIILIGFGSIGSNIVNSAQRKEIETLQRRVRDLEAAKPMPPVEELPFAEDCPAGEVK
jgi:hypothetical protein